jgi:hypothetical protein
MSLIGFSPLFFLPTSNYAVEFCDVKPSGFESGLTWSLGGELWLGGLLDGKVAYGWVHNTGSMGHDLGSSLSFGISTVLPRFPRRWFCPACARNDSTFPRSSPRDCKYCIVSTASTARTWRRCTSLESSRFGSRRLCQGTTRPHDLGFRCAIGLVPAYLLDIDSRFR